MATIINNRIFAAVIGLHALLLLGCTPSKKLPTNTPLLRQYTFQQVDSLLTKEARPIAVFLHTDWCRYCENMQQTTLRHAAVIRLLNEQYYFVSFNGEEQETVVFQNQAYHFRPTGRNSGAHELATKLGTQAGTLSYPGFVILDEGLSIRFQHNAFLNAAQLGQVLQANLNPT